MHHKKLENRIRNEGPVNQVKQFSTGSNSSLNNRFNNLIRKGRIGLKIMKEGAAFLKQPLKNNQADAVSISSSSTVKHPWYGSSIDRVLPKSKTNGSKLN